MEGESLLETLPAELLTYIHLLSLSSSLPFASRSLHNFFSTTSNHHRATYLKYRHSGSKLLSKALKYGICSLSVVRRLEEIVIRDVGPIKSKDMLNLEELPRRLIKYLKNSSTASNSFQVDLPFIYYLLSHYHSSPNSQKGYWLAKAVVERHIPLTKMLLRFGGDPSLKGGYAVILAIGNKDLDMVKLLLERGGEIEDDRDELPIFEQTGFDEEEKLESEVQISGGKRSRSSLGGTGSPEKVKVKRRKIAATNARCPATPEMLELAAKAKEWTIFKYLVSRGAIPSMEVIRLMDDI